MPKHQLSVLCRSVSVDPFSNELSINSVAEQITINTVTELPPPKGDELHNVSDFNWVLVTMLNRSEWDVPEELRGRVTIILPGGRQLAGPENPIDLKTSTGFRNFTRIPNLPYAMNGEYRFVFEVFLDTAWVAMGEYRIPIIVEHAVPEVRK